MKPLTPFVYPGIKCVAHYAIWPDTLAFLLLTGLYLFALPGKRR